MNELIKYIPLLTDHESEVNKQRIKELIDALKNNDAVLFVGAGLSLHACPSWDSLVQKLESLVTTCDPPFSKNETLRKSNPLKYVDEIKKFIIKTYGHDDRYKNELCAIFGKDNFLEIHKKLLHLPFIGIITTNYDTILESALKEIESNLPIQFWFTLDNDKARFISNFLKSLNRSTKIQRSIAHLHGIYNDPGKIILGEMDYFEHYGFDEKGSNFKKITIAYKFLWSILATRRVVFVGFSMNDKYIELMLKYVCNDLWSWKSGSHFFITDINNNNSNSQKTNAKKFYNDYGLSTIFYENLDEKHYGLESLVDDITASIFSESERNKSIIKGNPITNPNSQLNKKEEVELKQWANSINRKMIHKSKLDED